MGVATKALLGALAVAAASLPRPASAQLLDRYFPALTYGVGGPNAVDTLLLRPENTRPPGIRIGDVVVRATLQETLGYDSNVDGVRGGSASPVVATNAELTAATDWSRNGLEASLALSDQRYLDRPQQNQTNWTARLGGNVEIGRDRLDASFTHLNLNETPRTLGSLLVGRSVAYSVEDLRASYTLNTRGQLSLVPDIGVLLYRFENIRLPGSTVAQTYRDRNVYQAGLTAQYRLAPRRTLLLVGRYTHIAYQQPLAGLPSRDSNGAALLGGIDYEASGAIRYRALAGYQVRRYAGRPFGTLSAPILEASATWTPTGLTTITAALRRGIQDAADDNVAGYVFTGARLDVSHEYRRDILLHAYAQVQNAEYRSGVAAPQPFAFLVSAGSQTISSIGASATWIISRNLRAGVSYGYTDRRAGRAASYTENVGLVSVAIGL